MRIVDLGCGPAQGTLARVVVVTVGFVVLRLLMLPRQTMKQAVNRRQTDSSRLPAPAWLSAAGITVALAFHFVFVLVFVLFSDLAGVAQAADELVSTTNSSGEALSAPATIGNTGLTTEPVKGESISNETAIEITAAGTSHSKSIMAAFRFERSEDKNFDAFPDGWKRLRDSQHPPYLPVKIVAHNQKSLDLTRSIDRSMLAPWEKVRSQIGLLPPLPPSASDWLIDHYLRMELDGGAAMMQSPTIPFDPNFRYQLTGRMFTERLKHNHAFAELVFLNAAGEVIRNERAEAYSGTNRWTSLRTEMSAAPAGAAGMAIRLHLTPQQWGKDRDIYGTAGFDDLVVMQVPRVRIETDNRLAIYQPASQPVVRMSVMGLKDTTNTARFVVLDADGRQVARQDLAFQLEKVPSEDENKGDKKSKAANKVDNLEEFEAAFLVDPNSTAEAASKPETPKNDADQGAKTQVEIEALAQWKMPSLEPGFYTIRAGLIENGREWLRTETSLAVTADMPIMATAGPFGWALPDGIGNLDLKSVPPWLKDSGVFALKYPLWMAPDDRPAIDNAAWLTERLKESEIRCIGLLANPPPAIQTIIDERDKRQPVAANLFRDSRVWQPLLEPIMTRLTIRVPTWQLGVDGDHSFIGRPQLPEVIRTINRDLQGYGQPIGVAISWPWLDTLPPEVGAVASAVNRSSDEPLTSDELEAALQSAAAEPVAPSEPGKQRTRQENWVNINPLDKTKYDRDTRISDLLLRMGTVRGHSVSGAFISNPRDRKQGVLRSDWRPDDLYLPWRTASLLMGDVARVGTIDLEDAGLNMVFANDTRSMMMIWSPEPTTLDIYVGDKVRQIDAWGRQTIPEKVDVDGQVKHRVKLNRTPIFLVDVDPVIVSLRMTTRLVDERIDSLLGRRQRVGVIVRNPTSQTLSGTVALPPPNDWLVESPPQSFDLLPGEKRELQFEIVLRNSARIGNVPLQFQYLLRNEPVRRFTIERQIAVGPDGLDVEVTTKQVQNTLVVQLLLRNHSSKDQQYDCLLFPPEGRQYQRHQVSVAAGSTVRRDFNWEDAQSLVGKTMLLRAVEQGGGRILNQSINVTR